MSLYIQTDKTLVTSQCRGHENLRRFRCAASRMYIPLYDDLANRWIRQTIES